ncbi:hypothetical protein AVEN_90016-1 [Araneus ventricosus]|uniref:Uncharacterized protein n=1 Tax=Araneus ventricosus TaxID=182803 RepID=A0A4Y2DAC7_ARAVE|nr:hypothetical protein AVEN_90016-1 [Araneus ventricosus]
MDLNSHLQKFCYFEFSSLVYSNYCAVFEVKRGYFGTDLVILNHGQITRTTPELASPLQTSAPHQREDVWPHTYDLTCNRSTTRLILSGIGFRTWSPPAPRPTV